MPPPALHCRVCGRNDFESRRGLSFHLNKTSCGVIFEDSFPEMKRSRADENALLSHLAAPKPREVESPIIQQFEAQEQEEVVDFQVYADFAETHDNPPSPIHGGGDDGDDDGGGGPIILSAGLVEISSKPIQYERLLLLEEEEEEEQQDNHQPTALDIQAPQQQQELNFLASSISREATQQEEHAEVEAPPASLLGKASLHALPKSVTIQSSVSLFDQSMACFYKLFDTAGAPKYLCDDLFELLRQQILCNSFNPLNPEMTQRKSYFDRVQSRLGIPPPDSIPVLLESGQEVVVYPISFLGETATPFAI